MIDRGFKEFLEWKFKSIGTFLYYTYRAILLIIPLTFIIVVMIEEGFPSYGILGIFEAAILSSVLVPILGFAAPVLYFCSERIWRYDLIPIFLIIWGIFAIPHAIATVYFWVRPFYDEEKKNPMPKNIYYLSNDTIKIIRNQSYEKKSLSNFWVFLLIILTLIIYEIFSSLVISILALAFLVFGEQLIESRRKKKEIIKEYNKFYESVIDKPFLPDRSNVEPFYLWLKGPSAYFEASIISEELHAKIGEAYNSKNYSEWRLEDPETGEYITTRNYYNINRYFIIADSDHSAMQLATLYQVFKIHQGTV